MINPYAEMATTLTGSSLPLLLAMIGSMWLGFLFGWLYSPGPSSGNSALRGQLAALRAQLTDTEERLAATGRVMDKRLLEREEVLMKERTAQEQEMASLHNQLTSLKMALVAAKRPASLSVQVEERIVQDPALLARLAELEVHAQRNAELERELDEMRALLRTRGRSIGPVPAVLPKQVYDVMSNGFGKRIAPNDLQLVEGIGPKIQEQLKKNGLKTWADVAAAKPVELKKVLEKAGEHYAKHDPTHWPAQAKLMAENRWDELRKYQQKLGRIKHKA